MGIEVFSYCWYIFRKEVIITEKRKEFHDLLDAIHISNMSDKYIAKMQIETLRDWIIENTPTKLYRYYSYNPISEDDYNLKNLKNEEIWGSRISVFNDPYECARIAANGGDAIMSDYPDMAYAVVHGTYEW